VEYSIAYLWYTIVMNIHLIFHDSLYLFDILLVLSIIFFIAFKAKPGVAKSMLIVTWIGVIIFVVSHILGVSVDDPELSRKILMFNLVDLFLPLSTAHCVFTLLGKAKQQWRVLVASYVIAIGLAVFFIINPHLFLLESVPKMYFPNYYVPGPYYWVMLAYFGVLTAYFLLWMRNMYVISNGNEKNRIKYFLIALFFGFSIGSLDFFLIYNIQIDPLWGFLFIPFSVIPFTYAALQYELLDISVVAKKALVYAVMTAFIGFMLSLLNYANVIIIGNYPEFPNWIPSLVLALISAIAVVVTWTKIREGDILKYEFLNVVTHKFRTPLTTIKWNLENIRESVPEALKVDVQQIQTANERLVELTDTLVNLSSTEDKTYEYSLAESDIGSVLNECVAAVEDKAHAKSIQISYQEQPLIPVVADPKRIRFIFQTLLDDAVSYTPTGGTITITVKEIDGHFSRNNVSIKVSDTGIGIPKDEMRYIFTKFYRAKNARKADTEGMGIGLYLSKRIIERHRGKIWVESAGEGKGTTFTVMLPLV